MPDAHDETAPAQRRRRRADAERNVARILDAAVDALNDDPEAGMAEIARRAGLVRATVYVHFPTRDALVEAVTQRALTEARDAIAAAEPDRGEPAEALARVVTATWRTLGRYHPIIDINTRRHAQEQLHHRHESVLGDLQPLIERGQAAGAFRSDVPATWHLAMFIALVHAASAELRAGRIGEGEAQEALVATILGAATVAAP